jgi:hypothetical protein
MGLYKMQLLHPLFSPQAADFPEFCDGSAPKWLLGCTAMAKFEAKKWVDVVRNTPHEIHVDIIPMRLYKTHLLHPLSFPQAADFPKFHDGSAPKWLLGCAALAKFEAKKWIDVVRNVRIFTHGYL